MLLSKSATTFKTSTPSIIISLEDDWKVAWKWLSTWVFVLIAFLALLPDVVPSFIGVIPSKYIAVLSVVGIFVRIIKQGESKTDPDVVAADAQVSTVLNEINTSKSISSGGLGLSQDLKLAEGAVSAIEVVKASTSGSNVDSSAEKLESVLTTVANATSTNITPTATVEDVNVAKDATDAVSSIAPILTAIVSDVEKKP